MTKSTEFDSDASSGSSSGVAVLDRAFALLGAFGPSDERLTLTQLANRTGLYKSTVLRLLAALEYGGFIRKLPDAQYSIGPQPLRLASIYQRSFQVGHVIEPLLKQLSADTEETASFYVRHGDKRVALFRAEPARAVRAAVQIGQEYEVTQGASGKVLLAFTSPPPAKFQRIRDCCWSTSYGERDPETASVASPVFTLDGELIGALTLSAPRQRLTAPRVMLNACRQVMEAARKATSALGGDAQCFDRSLADLDASHFLPPDSRAKSLPG